MVPDDDEYDTEDSFIDDTELVSYCCLVNIFASFDLSIIILHTNLSLAIGEDLILLFEWYGAG